VVTENGCFAAGPSGIEDIYKIYPGCSFGFRFSIKFRVSHQDPGDLPDFQHNG